MPSRATSCALAVALAISLACGGAPGELPSGAPVSDEAAGGPQVALDAMLDPLARGCEISPALDALVAGLASAVNDGERWAAGPGFDEAAFPAYKAVFGKPMPPVDRGEYSELSASVQGATWHGIPVRRVDRMAGHQNGVSAVSFVLGAPLAEVEATLRAKLTIVDSCVGIDDCVTDPIVLGFAAHEGGETLVTCDWSM